MANIVLDDAGLENYSPISIGRLRNGDAADMVRTARESSLAVRYHDITLRWSDAMSGNAAAFVPPCPAVVALDANVRSCFGQIVASNVRDLRTAARGGTFNEATAYASEVAKVENKLAAIGLGAARTGILFSYMKVDADLRPTEAVEPILKVVPPAASADLAAYNAQLTTATRGWRVSLVSTHTAANMTVKERAAVGMTPLTAAEAEVAFYALAMGQSAPLRAGAQLYIDGHHYHSNPEASRRHAATEREVLGTATADASGLWRSNIGLFRDVIWHASVHPLEESRLTRWAEDPHIIELLAQTGYGTMSIGLPAVEDVVRRGDAYIALITAIAPSLAGAGHVLTTTNLTSTLAMIKKLPRHGNLSGRRPAFAGNPEGAWPTEVTTRADAITAYLEPVLRDAEPSIAWVYGYYSASLGGGGAVQAAGQSTLLDSYALRRAAGNYAASTLSGQTAWATRMRYVRNEADEGRLERYTAAI